MRTLAGLAWLAVTLLLPRPPVREADFVRAIPPDFSLHTFFAVISEIL
jgi:hypothetical protein